MNLKQLGFIVVIGLLVWSCTPINRQSQNPIKTETNQLDERVTPLQERQFRQIKVGDHEIKVEVVDTPEKSSLGLSYRDEIGADGMLFVLARRGMPTFWMKGMRIPLDMIWIDCLQPEQLTEEIGQSGKECQVADITRNVPVPEDPEDLTSLPTYHPKSPVQYVLEVPAGWSIQQAIDIGALVRL